MSIITYTGHNISIKNGALCASEDESNSVGILKIKNLILIYDKNGNPFSVYGDNMVYGYFIRLSNINNSFYSLVDVKLNKFMSYIKNLNQNKFETRENVNEWEIFQIKNINNYDNYDKNISSIDDIFFEDFSVSLKRSFVSAYIEFCSEKDFNIVGRKMYNDVSYNIENIFSEENIYIKEIKKIKKWLSKRKTKKQYVDIKNNYNDIYHTSKGLGLISTEEKILHSFRRSIPPIMNSAVVATARNEGVYLLDWISHYQSLGFDDIFIYSNNNSDGSDVLLKALSDNGIIFWINNDIPPLGDAQSKSYSHALMLNEQILNYRWVAFFDLDEFLFLNNNFFSTVNDFLLWHDCYDTDIIGVNWTFVGSKSELFWKNDEMYKRFGFDSLINPHIKSIIKPNKFIGSKPHYPCWYARYNPSFRESDRTEHKYSNVIIPGEMAFSEKPTSEYATLYHYFHKSAEEFLWKFSRNRGDYPAHIEDININIPENLLIGFINDYKSNYKKNTVNDINYIEKKTCMLDSMLSISEINLAQNFIVQSFKDRMNRIKFEFFKKTKTQHEEIFAEILKNTQDPNAS